MKKKGILLVVIAFVISMVMSPLGVHAASGTIFGSDTQTMTKTTQDGDVKLVYDKDGEAPKIYLGVKLTDTVGGAFTDYNAELELKNSNFTFSGTDENIKLVSGWSGTISKSDANGKVKISLHHNRGITTLNQNVLVATLTLTVKEETEDDAKCQMTLTQTTAETTPKCQKDGSTYYCADGLTCDEEKYNKECTTSENPQTGSFLPYAVMIGGAAVAVGLYVMTKKNKIYHI